MKFLLTPGIVLCAVGMTSAQSFTLLDTIDVSSVTDDTNPSNYIGNAPSAIAWDGTDLYVAGFNNGASSMITGIVRVQDALTSPTFGSPFGIQSSTPNQRGYSGLDIASDVLMAAYDDGGANPAGISAYMPSGTQSWAQSGRGGSGIGYDVGPNGSGSAMGSGAGWTTFGSGRRSLNDLATGAVIWDSTNGMIINGSGTGTFWRDMDYDANTGDIWLREGNNVITAVRTGDNSVNTAQLIVDETEADFVNGQNISFMTRTGQDYVIYNKRATAVGGQVFFDVVTVILPDGTVVAVDWGTFAPPTGPAYYDFDWHEDSETLAILDLDADAVYLFQFDEGTATTYCTAKSTLVCGVPAISFTGGSSASSTSGFDIDAAPARGQRSGILLYTDSGRASFPFQGGILCVNPSPLLRTVSVNSGGTNGGCDGVFTLDMNAFASGGLGGNPDAFLSAPGTQVNTQWWGRDSVATGSFLSNGLEYVVGP